MKCPLFILKYGLEKIEIEEGVKEEVKDPLYLTRYFKFI